MAHSLFWFLVFLRLLTPFLIFLQPLLGIITVLFFDFIDALVWIHYLHLNRQQYYAIDKIIDWFVYTVLLFSAINYWYFFPLFVLFLYRLIGYFVVILGHRPRLYILFPNFFEFAFIWFTLFPFWHYSIIVLFVLKVLQEVWIYWLWPEYLHKNGYLPILKIFGQKNQVAW